MQQASDYEDQLGLPKGSVVNIIDDTQKPKTQLPPKH